MDPLQRLLTSAPRFKILYGALGAIRFDWFHDRSYRIYVLKEMKFDKEQLKNLPRGIGSVRVVNQGQLSTE
jgi:hypothetical protein